MPRTENDLEVDFERAKVMFGRRGVTANDERSGKIAGGRWPSDSRDRSDALVGNWQKLVWPAAGGNSLLAQ